MVLGINKEFVKYVLANIIHRVVRIDINCRINKPIMGWEMFLEFEMVSGEVNPPYIYFYWLTEALTVKML